MQLQVFLVLFLREVPTQVHSLPDELDVAHRHHLIPCLQPPRPTPQETEGGLVTGGRFALRDEFLQEVAVDVVVVDGVLSGVVFDGFLALPFGTFKVALQFVLLPEREVPHGLVLPVARTVRTACGSSIEGLVIFSLTCRLQFYFQHSPLPRFHSVRVGWAAQAMARTFGQKFALKGGLKMFLHQNIFNNA